MLHPSAGGLLDAEFVRALCCGEGDHWVMQLKWLLEIACRVFETVVSVSDACVSARRTKRTLCLC